MVMLDSKEGLQPDGSMSTLFTNALPMRSVKTVGFASVMLSSDTHGQR